MPTHHATVVAKLLGRPFRGEHVPTLEQRIVVDTRMNPRVAWLGV